MEIFTSLFYQLFFTVGIIAVFGLLLVFFQRGFCAILGGNNGYKILLATGVVGTPIHELSHAVMCILFGHRIDEIRLYQPNDEDGTLGYVNHSYNEKNWYQQIGNFFIGIAPILCGSGVLILLMRFLAPETFADFQLVLRDFTAQADFSFIDFLSLLGVALRGLFQVKNFSSFSWWIFMLLALMISNHMGLSGADVKNGFKGFLFLASALLLVDAALYFFARPLLYTLTATITSFSLYIVGFLILAAAFSTLMLAIALLVRLIGKARK